MREINSCSTLSWPSPLSRVDILKQARQESSPKAFTHNYTHHELTNNPKNDNLLED